MVTSLGLRAALSLSLLLLAGCGTPITTAPALPAITMTSGGGFEGTSQVWTVAPDGSWKWTHEGTAAPPRAGRLTEAQRRELAVLATDPLLQHELRGRRHRCDISDGPEERLEVGSLRYLAGWCDGRRPHIAELRTRIPALTTTT
ncbi:MAG: hypothetical protein ABW000_11625 [Actinoplanes sp.]